MAPEDDRLPDEGRRAGPRGLVFGLVGGAITWCVLVVVALKLF